MNLAIERLQAFRLLLQILEVLSTSAGLNLRASHHTFDDD